jgi:UDP-N-acetylmuramoylalanine--D-glutamate ligase
LGVVGATVRLGDGDTLPSDADVLIVSPGLPPSAPIIVAALADGVPVWGELELAWRLRGDNPAAWLMVTGTNGKTTTTLMLESILRAAGLRTASVGNIGVSLVDAVMDPMGFDVFAVEVGAPQLPFLYSASPVASVCLNLAPDHVDLFGSFEAYRDAKARIYRNTQIAAVYNVLDPETERMVEEADVVEGCRAIGVTLGVPGRSMFGVVEDLLVDRAFIENRADAALELGSVELVKPFAPHNVSNALAASALARAYGVPAAAIAAGLLQFEAAGHRIATVADHEGVLWVDDSKATNCHAAQTSLLAYESVIWIAGGMAKGQEFDELVQLAGSRMRGVVLLGVDRDKIREALVRHAPDVPIVEVPRTDTGAMDDVVLAAAAMAKAGDTVLLAPGCASWDMFRDYAHRGDAFADSITRLVLT